LIKEKAKEENIAFATLLHSKFFCIQNSRLHRYSAGNFTLLFLLVLESYI